MVIQRGHLLGHLLVSFKGSFFGPFRHVIPVGIEISQGVIYCDIFEGVLYLGLLECSFKDSFDWSLLTGIIQMESMNVIWRGHSEGLFIPMKQTCLCSQSTVWLKYTVMFASSPT